MEKQILNYILSINHEGRDYQVEVKDLETANLLTNDPEAAHQFMVNYLKNLRSQGQVLNEQEENQFDLWEWDSQVDAQSHSQCDNKFFFSDYSDYIWTGKKRTPKDQEATALLLALRDAKQKLFDDRKTRKAKLWGDIAKELEQQGFLLGPNGGERDRQKFANLQKAYMAYINNQKATGSEACEVPAFFEELHANLGAKHKVNRPRLDDSLVDMEIPFSSTQYASKKVISEGEELMDAAVVPALLTSNVMQPIPSTSNIREPIASTENVSDSNPSKSTVSGRFKNVTRKIAPSRQDKLLKELRQDREDRKREFQFFRKHLEQSEEQRDKLLRILSNAFKNKRRNHLAESSDSDNYN